MTERSKVTGTPEVNTMNHPPHSELLFYDSHNVEKGRPGSQSRKRQNGSKFYSNALWISRFSFFDVSHFAAGALALRFTFDSLWGPRARTERSHAFDIHVE